jgi:hypothetical protein
MPIATLRDTVRNAGDDDAAEAGPGRDYCN